MNSFLNGAFPLFNESSNSNNNNNTKSLDNYLLDNHNNQSNQR